MNKKLYIKWFTILFSIEIILVSLLFITAYKIRTNLLINNVINREENAVHLKKSILEKNFISITSDLKMFSKNIRLLDYLDDPSDEEKNKLQKEWLMFSKSKEIYDQIRYFNESGQEIIRINFNNGDPYIVTDPKLQNKFKRYYFKDTYALKKNRIFISPFDLNIEKGKIEKPLKPMIRFGTPVFDKSENKRGIVMLNYLGNNLIQNLEQVSKDMAGDHLMINSEGYFIIGLKKEDEWGFMFNNNKRMESRFPYAWKDLSKKVKGYVVLKSGIFIFDSVKPLRKDWISSTGSPYPFGNSENKTKADDYYWKVISYLSPSNLNLAKKDLLKSLINFYIIIIILFTILIAFLAKYYVNKKELDSEKKEYNEEREKMIIELKESLENIKTLSGLIPICSSCKKVRNDEGYWNHIELYIEKHSDAQISHGICKNCEVKLYGDQEWYKKREKKKKEQQNLEESKPDN